MAWLSLPPEELIATSAPRSISARHWRGTSMWGRLRSNGNGGAKLVHGSGGIVSLRAEQNSAT